MSQTHLALALFFVLFVIVLPLIIKKYNIKDDLKLRSTLPIGTAKFRAFLKLMGWLLIALVLLALGVSTLDLIGINI